MKLVLLISMLASLAASNAFAEGGGGDGNGNPPKREKGEISATSGAGNDGN